MKAYSNADGTLNFDLKCRRCMKRIPTDTVDINNRVLAMILPEDCPECGVHFVAVGMDGLDRARRDEIEERGLTHE